MQEMTVEDADGVLLMRNANTTIGYCRYAPDGTVDYIFVNPHFRREGYGTALVERVASATGAAPRPGEPVSPLGRRFFDSLPPCGITVPDDMTGALRSDHAGETGAVWIYRGILALSRDPDLRDFAERHLATEARHLRDIERVLPSQHHSRLLPVWRVAGFLTGALPALFGPRAVYGTIASVETFVDRHYQHQIDALAGRPADAALRDLLIRCQADERHHRDEAAEQAPGQGIILRAWSAVVGSGSALAVQFAERI